MSEQESDERQTRSQSAKVTLPPALNDPVDNVQEIFMDEIPEACPRVILFCPGGV